MKSMMQPKNGHTVPYYAKNPIASNLCLLARGQPTRNVLSFLL